MKKSFLWVLLGMAACVGGMGFIHWRAVETVDDQTIRIETLYERQETVDALTLALEKYRRLSSNFRKMGAGEIQGAKDELKASFKKGIARYESLAPSPDEAASAKRAGEQMLELLSESAKHEAALYSKDAYAKGEIRELHDSAVGQLAKLKKGIQAKIDSTGTVSTDSQLRSLWLILGVGIAVLALALFVILKDYLVYARPLRKLHRFAASFRGGASAASSPAVARLGGVHGEIQSIIESLVQKVEAHSKERRKFVQDVVSDLRSPLSLLQSGKGLVKGEGDRERQLQVADSMKRGIAILSGSLDDLDDVADINRLESKLEEKTIDLAELVTDVARTLGGAGSARQVSVAVPPMPVWVALDTRRMERVLVQVVSKIMSVSHEASSALITVSDTGEGRHGGVEIIVRETGSRKGEWTATGPEVDVLRHWISENGLGMALAQKVVRAHGGAMTASGAAGSSVQVRIQLPQERVLSRGLIAPPAGLSTGTAMRAEAPKTVLRNSL